MSGKESVVAALATLFALTLAALIALILTFVALMKLKVISVKVLKRPSDTCWCFTICKSGKFSSFQRIFTFFFQSDA